MRSEATISRRSPRSYISRTLPLASSGRESSVAAALMEPKVATNAVVAAVEKGALCGGRELEPGPLPLHRRQPSGSGERDVRRSQVVAAEADVRGEDLALGRHERDDLSALPVDHADPAVHERRLADVPLAVDGQRVEALEAARRVQQRATVRENARHLLDLARRRDLPPPDRVAERLGDVEPRTVGREADAVRRVQRED